MSGILRVILRNWKIEKVLIDSRVLSDSSDQNSSFSTCLNRFPFTSSSGQVESMAKLIHVVNTPTGHCYT